MTESKPTLDSERGVAMRKFLDYLKQNAVYIAIGLLASFGVTYLISRAYPDPIEMGDFERSGRYQQSVCENYCKGANLIHRNSSAVELRGHFKAHRNADDFDCVCAPDLIDAE